MLNADITERKPKIEDIFNGQSCWDKNCCRTKYNPGKEQYQKMRLKKNNPLIFLNRNILKTSKICRKQKYFEKDLNLPGT